MRRVLATIAVLTVLALGASSALAVEFGVRGEYWFPRLSGTVQTTTGGIPDTVLDVRNTLGVKDKNLPFGEAFLRIGSVTLRVGYTQVRLDGDKELLQTITFDGATYTVSDNVLSKLDLKTADADLQYDFLRPGVGAANLNLGLILKVKYVDGKVELRSVSTGVATTKDFKAPIPMVGAAVGLGLLKNRVRADARVTGIVYSGNHLYEADAFATLAPLPYVQIHGGYRYVDLKIDESDTLASLKLSGPYVGAQISF